MEKLLINTKFQENIIINGNTYIYNNGQNSLEFVEFIHSNRHKIILDNKFLLCINDNFLRITIGKRIIIDILNYDINILLLNFFVDILLLNAKNINTNIQFDSLIVNDHPNYNIFFNNKYIKTLTIANGDQNIIHKYIKISNIGLLILHDYYLKLQNKKLLGYPKLSLKGDFEKYEIFIDEIKQKFKNQHKIYIKFLCKNEDIIINYNLYIADYKMLKYIYKKMHLLPKNAIINITIRNLHNYKSMLMFWQLCNNFNQILFCICDLHLNKSYKQTKKIAKLFTNINITNL